MAKTTGMLASLVNMVRREPPPPTSDAEMVARLAAVMGKTSPATTGPTGVVGDDDLPDLPIHQVADNVRVPESARILKMAPAPPTPQPKPNGNGVAKKLDTLDPEAHLQVEKFLPSLRKAAIVLADDYTAGGMQA